MWAQAGKESLKEDSLTDLGSHFYGNQVARAECLILFWAVVATNYRQLYVPLLFPRKVSIYLLARFIYFPPPSPFWILFSSFTSSFREKKIFVVSGGCLLSWLLWR